MTLNVPRPGFNSVPEYTISGLPHALSGSATSTPSVIEFPNVTRAITVTNNSPPGTYLLVGFTQNGVNLANSFPLNGGQMQRFELRVRDLWLKASGGASAQYGVLAELTAIERRNMLPLTGSIDTSTYQGQLQATGSILWPGVG